MAFYFLPTIGEFTKEILNLFQIQGIQQDCVHGRLGRKGEEEIVRSVNLFVEHRGHLQQ